MVLSSFGPINRLIRVLAHGKERVKAVGRPCLLTWDSDYRGLKIKDVHLRLNAFQQFVHDGIKSTETILREQLFFEMNLPTIDLRKIKDEYGKIDPGYSFLKGSADILPDGCQFMFNLMKSADPSKHLIDAQGRWDTAKVMEYLKSNKKVLRRLMKGIYRSKLLSLLRSDVFFTEGRSSRGFELGSAKYKNTRSCSRNLAILNGEAFVASEYNKSRASTNYSFHVARFLPEPVAILMILYLTYVRPFVKMLFNNTQSPQPRQQEKKAKKVGRSVQKQAGQRRKVRKRYVRAAGEKDDETLDRGYIFCSDERPNQCWTGVQLSEILQEESLKRLRVKINLWAWRHIIIGITKAHLEEIAPFFSRDEKVCKERLDKNIYYSIFPWQAGYQPRINLSVYGLDAAFPGRVQPALLRFYRRISRIWHCWLGLLEPKELMSDGNIEKWIEKNESPEHARKRRKVVDSETQVTPKKKSAILDIRVEDSPVTKA